MKLYRGYNKDYPNWGIRPNQNYIWTTDDIDYALEYTKLFDNGGLVEFDVDVNQLNLADDYDGEKLFGDEWYDFGGLIDADNDMIQVFIDNGFNSALLDNSGIDCYLLFDKKLIKSAKELPLNNIENKLNESYQLFKNIYLKEHTGFIVRETPASYLTYIKNYIQKVLDYEPNANNYPFITEDKKYYWDRIAGYYNVDTKEFIYISPDETHQNEEEYYKKNYVRFFIADIKHRALYVSHIDYNIAYKGYKAIEEKYKDFGIEYSVVEWYENNDWKEITFDDKGHKVKITQIYEEFKKYVMPLYEQQFNKEINEVLRIAGIQINESKYTVKGITFYEDPSIKWIKTQLNNGKELRIAIDGNLDEPYFGQWLVWDAYSANHNKAFQILGMYEEDSINLRLSKDAITYWRYSDNQINKLSQCEDIQKLYPNGYKLIKEW